jgi:hypothetical protein
MGPLVIYEKLLLLFGSMLFEKQDLQASLLLILQVQSSVPFEDSLPLTGLLPLKELPS